MSINIEIRPQNSTTDLDTICAINDAAFADHGGTKAFDQFRAERTDILSLVAIDAGEISGHVLFSPVTLATPDGVVSGMGLGQLAVMPDRQKLGIGSKLSRAGIAQLGAQNCPFIIVIGHAEYYPRFGFEPGSRHGVKCQWDGVPDETFMVLFPDETQQGKLQGVASFDGL